jgi:hypothetical protein
MVNVGAFVGDYKASSAGLGGANMYITYIVKQIYVWMFLRI